MCSAQIAAQLSPNQRCAVTRVYFRRSSYISIRNADCSDSHYNILPLQVLHSSECCVLPTFQDSIAVWTASKKPPVCVTQGLIRAKGSNSYGKKACDLNINSHCVNLCVLLVSELLMWMGMHCIVKCNVSRTMGIVLERSVYIRCEGISALSGKILKSLFY